MVKRRWGLAAGAYAGIVSGLVVVGVATFIGGFMLRVGLSKGTPSPVLAVGNAFINHTPLWLKELAINTFGTHDKLALLTGITVFLVLVCAAIGVVAVRRLTLALVGVALLGAVAIGAVVTRNHAALPDAIPTLAGTLLGMLALSRLVGGREAQQEGVPVDRRAVLRAGSILGILGLGATYIGQHFGGRAAQALQSRAAVKVPAVSDPVTIPASASLPVKGITPFRTSNGDFYRIDTALVVPQLSTSSWSLRVHGMVDHEITIDWNTLISKPMQQAMVTLCCVSNEVGGNLISNAVWTGWPVRELLAMAGPQSGADMVLSTSSDGFTAGTPLTALTDHRNALLAVGMNGQPLPLEHGFPVRLVVPGLYGYVSATKWLVDLKVTTYSQDMGYWTPRGWSAKGPVKTESRIDVPRSGARVSAGKVAVAGVAWAQHRGIDEVQVRVDKGSWQTARMASEPSIDAWRQWVYEWDATPGHHVLSVRATDGKHHAQTSVNAPPPPNGASGYHTIGVTVA